MVGSGKSPAVATGWGVEVAWARPNWEGRRPTPGSPEELLLTCKSKETGAKNNLTRRWTLGNGAALLSSSLALSVMYKECPPMSTASSQVMPLPCEPRDPWTVKAGGHALATSIEWGGKKKSLSILPFWNRNFKVLKPRYKIMNKVQSISALYTTT